MGEVESTQLRLTCNRSIRIEGRGHRLTGSAGALLLREVDERILGVTRFLTDRLKDDRAASHVRHPLSALLRTRLYGLALGHRRQEDADRLRQDPALRAAVGETRGVGHLAEGSGGLPSQPTLSRLAHALGQPTNYKALGDALIETTRRDLLAHRSRPHRQAVLDVDSFAIEVHGHQPGSAYNGHYGMRCYHPIATFLSETGHCLAADLRPGNAHTAKNAADHLLDVIDKVETRGIAQVTAIRGDAGFPSDPLLCALEERAVNYVFRLRSNPRLQRMAEPYLRRPVGRPPQEPREWIHELEYQAGSWNHPRRVVLVVVERRDELLLDYFFLVTSWAPAQKRGCTVLELYRQRGTLEKHLGELQTVLEPTLSSTRRTKSHVRGRQPRTRAPERDPERSNAATFRLFTLAYNLLTTVRRLAVGRSHKRIGLRGLRARFLAIPARLTISARRATFIVNEVIAGLWARLLRRMAQLVPL